MFRPMAARHLSWEIQEVSFLRRELWSKIFWEASMPVIVRSFILWLGELKWLDTALSFFSYLWYYIIESSHISYSMYQYNLLHRTFLRHVVLFHWVLLSTNWSCNGGKNCNTIISVSCKLNSFMPTLILKLSSHLPITWTWNWHVPLFPLLSRATHVTLVSPIPNSDPDGGSHSTVGVSLELSVAFGVLYVITALELTVLADTSGGQEITGGSISRVKKCVLRLDEFSFGVESLFIPSTFELTFEYPKFRGCCCCFFFVVVVVAIFPERNGHFVPTWFIVNEIAQGDKSR